MAISREKKKKILDAVRDAASRAESLVFANFHGLPVSHEQTMRSKLKEKGVTYVVAKKRLVKKALEGTDVSGELPPLLGELAIAYSTGTGDPTHAPRELNVFVKEYKDKLSIIGGIFGRAFLSKEAMQDIASIPSRGILYAQVVNVINAPIWNLVVALNAIAEKKG